MSFFNHLGHNDNPKLKIRITGNETNEELALLISINYGIDDINSIIKFLENNPFQLTENGVKMAGKEQLSSKPSTNNEIMGKGLKFGIQKMMGSVLKKSLWFWCW